MLRDYIRRLYRFLIPFLYARTNYKLFLRKTILDLDREIGMMMCAIDILPSIISPIALKPPFGKAALVVAPHQDDEIIGCGGALLLQLHAGAEVHIVFVQDGGDEYRQDGFSAREELVRIRESEASRVASALGIAPPVFLRFNSLNPDKVKTISEHLYRMMVELDPDIIFSPFILDYNWDHRISSYALAEAIGRLKKKPKVWGYEVWGLCIPNVIVNIDDVMDKKQALLSMYASQTAGTDYVNCTTGINMYHARAFGAGVCRYAERFFEMPGDDFVKVVNALRLKSSE